MPELPEVHTTIEGLKRVVIGKKIKEVWSDFHLGTSHSHKQNIKNFHYLQNLKKKIVGAKIKSINRLGKNILINLNNGVTIIVHMKMTGHLLVKGFEKEEKFIHFYISLSGNQKLALSDMRKFASVCIVETKKLGEHEGLKHLGPDALKISLEEFKNKIKSKKWAIKKTLLDQTLVAGIGNIYSDEILWAAGVHPLSSSNKIKEADLKKMFQEMKKVLKKSIMLGGDSMSDYLNAFGEKGGFQKCHKAYRRTGLSCPKTGCRGKILRIMVAGRSSHFCPAHQKIQK